MAVNALHPLYVQRHDQWRRCRDAKGGTDPVKAAGVKYLPTLDGLDVFQYDAYKMRAMFYPATERTVEGLTGLVLRRMPSLEVPPSVEADLTDLSLSGQSWESFLLEVLDETITVGRLGILIEYTRVEGTRPYWTLYRAEQIVNWHLGEVLGEDDVPRTAPTRIVLREEVPAPTQADAFDVKFIEQYRVLELRNNVYTVSLWRRRSDVEASSLATDWVQIEEIVPQRKSKVLTAIPFVFIGARHARPFPDKPPLLDMVDVNLSHYRSSADLEHGRHWTALPTPWVTGYSGTTPLKIGSTVAWALQSPETRVGMLEFTGTGLAALVTALEQKEHLMAILGARLLEGQPMRNETAEAVRLRHAGEAATLTSIAQAIEEGMTVACRWHAWWAGDDDAFTTEGITVSLNKDFFVSQMEPQQASTALTMWQAGGISWETYFWLLQRGEWMRPGVTIEQEKAAIDAEAAEAAANAPDFTPGAEPDAEPSDKPDDPDDKEA